MNIVYIAALLAIVFVLSYKPKENFTKNPQCCNNTPYMAQNATQCENAHFQGVQFGNQQYGCPARHPQANLGAIIGN